MGKEFERKDFEKARQISFEKAQKSPTKKPGLFWAGLFTLANPDTKTEISLKKWSFLGQWIYEF